MEGIGSNQYFMGGFFLLLVGNVMNFVLKLLYFLGQVLVHKLFVAVDVNNTESIDVSTAFFGSQLLTAFRMHTDGCFSGFQNVQKMSYAAPKSFTSQRWSIMVKQKWNSKLAFNRKSDDLARETPKVVYALGPGFHICLYRKYVVCILREIHSFNNNGQQSEHVPLETITIYAGQKQIVHSMVEEAMNYCLDQDRDKTVIYVVDSTFGINWTRAIARTRRPLDSVILNSDIAEKILTDAKKFLGSEQWYQSLGVPFRRSYFLHGKPGTYHIRISLTDGSHLFDEGCGKTSFVAALAGELGLNICVLTLSSKNLNDTYLCSLLRDAPRNALILLEDVDCTFPEARQTEMSKEKTKGNVLYMGQPLGVTFSGLLNAIDGIASQEGRIFFMTSNHPEHLDAALIRPGRMDYIAHFPLATKNQARRMFERFYPKEKELARQLEAIWVEDKVSMAQLQGHFLSYSDDPLGALSTVAALKENNFAPEEKEKVVTKTKNDIFNGK